MKSDLVRAAERLCDLVEAFLRNGDDAVPESLRGTTEADVVDAMYETRAVVARVTGGA